MFKKTLATVALVAVSSLALTGCIKETSQFTVSKKQTVTGSLKLEVDNEMWDLMRMLDEDIEGASEMSRREYIEASLASADATGDLPSGITMKTISGKNYSGLKISFSKASFKKVNKLGRAMNAEEGKKNPAMFKIALNKKKQVTFKYRVEAMGSDGEDMSMLEGSDAPRYKVSVTMPGKVLKTNGKRSKRTVTWKGTYPEKKSLSLTATSKRK